ncbi:hypothetical protein GCM10010840_25470 [Deinococcus aerolatus]|uniref:Uncharacterized protein n=1 Tax=Deinococcus aerolatus TaxID=522487 RepID=A0ABQ2GD44_9DEIO|nr:hypothetical protein [Deinococcus aerolatus]GGL86386.1 hypothetical protein GCM10010840_25470 [Deinococcus aerolatus]
MTKDRVLADPLDGSCAAWTHESTLAEIEAQAGRHFDAVLTGVFVELLDREEGAARRPRLF